MTDPTNLNRRHFLQGITAGALSAGVAVEAQAQQKAPEKAAAKPDAAKKPDSAAAPAEVLGGPPVNVAVIGMGPRGREILTSLARIGPVPQITYVCDTFKAPVFIKKSAEIAPKATFVEDYRSVLSNPQVQAVIVATPTHKHKQIVLDALAAGKHVYCEAPLAHTVEDAKAIAQAAKAGKPVFHAGLQNRCNGQTVHVMNFAHSKAWGKVTQARASWHNKSTWRAAWPTEERQAELNWRLRKASSAGLAGEVGIHQMDTASFYFKQLPVSVTGFGGILVHNDGREVPDTVQCVIEYPGGVRLVYDATLTSSFEGSYELFQGTDCSILLRDQRAWMFKETDAGQLGWEVFARKDPFAIGDPTTGAGEKVAVGIALVADATKQLALGKQPGEVGTDVTKTALYQSLVRFLVSCQKGERAPAVEPTTAHPKPPLVPGAVEGYEATVVALKANEAILTGSKVTFQPDWFTL
jgi:predicted dehydrogenase